jgi:hypothetical protein
MGYPVLCVYLIYHVYPAIFVPWHIQLKDAVSCK